MVIFSKRLVLLFSVLRMHVLQSVHIFLPPPCKRLLSFCLAPAHFLQVNTPRPNSRMDLHQATPHLMLATAKGAGGSSCGQHALQQPKAPLSVLGALPGQQTTDPGSTWSVSTVGSSMKGIQAPRTPYLQCRILQPGGPPGQHPRASFLQHVCCECYDVIRRRTPRCHVMALESLGWEQDRRSQGGVGRPWMFQRRQVTVKLTSIQSVCLDACLLLGLVWKVRGNSTQEQSTLLQVPSI